MSQNNKSTIRTNQRLGKYRIERKLGTGGFAAVYQALDTLEGVHVALKIPHDRLVTEQVLDGFRREVRLAAKLNHPHILPLKNAEFIDGHLVVAFPLGERTLADRLLSRISLETALDYAEQMIEAAAFAHEHSIIHCDIKPENLILFPRGKLMLTDFGIAKVAMNTIRASGSGTVGFIAPEQAMGHPSFRSDVFSLGLIMYRMFTGHLPEWPFQWPLPGHERLRRLHPDLVGMVRRAISLYPRKRYKDAGQMLSALQRVKTRALRHGSKGSGRLSVAKTRDWRAVQRRQFLRQFGKQLETDHLCPKCDSPVSESMQFCPWCAAERRVHRGDTDFPQQCPRCHRGLKLDWQYCPWCFGPGFELRSRRHYTDKRYTARCANPHCSRRALMPFMRYCPWCRRKVGRRWKVEGSDDRCGSCGWGVISAFWAFCPWCGRSLSATPKR